jgi:hypothetical protein
VMAELWRHTYVAFFADLALHGHEHELDLF